MKPIRSAQFLSAHDSGQYLGCGWMWLDVADCADQSIHNGGEYSFLPISSGLRPKSCRRQPGLRQIGATL